MADTYASCDELFTKHKEDVDFRIRFRNIGSRYAIVAPHGGGIERGTSEVAEAVASNDFSFYAFEGRLLEGNKLLHITSDRFKDERCTRLIKSSECVITIHGDERETDIVYLGGNHKDMKAHIRKSLTERGFDVESDTIHPGEKDENICNRGKSGEGVQIEIAHGLRKTLFASLDRRGRKNPTLRFYQLVAALREALLN